MGGPPIDKIVVATENEMVVSNHDIYLNDMMPCNIEQAVENLFLHTLDLSIMML